MYTENKVVLFYAIIRQLSQCFNTVIFLHRTFFEREALNMHVRGDGWHSTTANYSYCFLLQVQELLVSSQSRQERCQLKR